MKKGLAKAIKSELVLNITRCFFGKN